MRTRSAGSSDSDRSMGDDDATEKATEAPAAPRGEGRSDDAPSAVRPGRNPFRAPVSRRRRAFRIALLATPLVLGLWGWAAMIRMPGRSFEGPLPPLTSGEEVLRDELERDVRTLALDIGERHAQRYGALQDAAEFIEGALRSAGHDVARQGYPLDGRTYENLEVEIPGGARANEILVVGAHYDSEVGTPGANDNGSGVAALLALARRLADDRPARTVRLVAFVNEEMPHFREGTMGSGVYARRCRDRGETVAGMISLETMGYFSDEPGSQRYPFPFGLFYPDRGNFIGFIGNLESRDLVRSAISSFRRHARFPSEGGALPAWVPGVGWSDHASFWAHDYPAIMITDTAPFRYPHYHRRTDTPDRVDYPGLSRVVSGVVAMVRELADAR